MRPATDDSNEEYLTEKLLANDENDDEIPNLRISKRPTRWTTIAHWVAHVVLAISLGLSIVRPQYSSSSKLCVRPTEEIYSDLSSHLEPEYRSMQPLVGPNQVKDDSWIGPINAENFWKWDAITTIGVASISDHEQAKMGMYTSRANETGEYFIVPQVFHALHCLKRMREAWWEHGLNITYHDKIHLDHCVDNFRQNLMCTADLSPIPFHWGGDKHRADYNTIRQCRKWDLIEEWAKKRNTTGYVL